VFDFGQELKVWHILFLFRYLASLLFNSISKNGGSGPDFLIQLGSISSFYISNNVSHQITPKRYFDLLNEFLCRK